MDINATNERMFNVRAAIPGHMDVFADWQARSAAYRAGCPDAKLGLAYGSGTSETVDIFPARDADGPAPLAVIIHGGYWQALDKDDISFAASALNDAGIAVAVPNHTLCPEISLAGIVEQIARASLWLWQNGGGLGIDPARMHVIGHSAGGHLAAMMLCHDFGNMNKAAPQGPLYHSAVAVSGLFDLEDLVETTINRKLGLDRQTARALSPVNCVPAQPVPVLVAVGGAESDGFHDQSGRLAKAWFSHGLAVERMTLPGSNHLEAFEALASPGTALARRAIALASS